MRYVVKGLHRFTQGTVLEKAGRQHTQAGMSTRTLYLRNINEKVGLGNVKQEISRLFEKEGGFSLEEIYVCKNIQHKGQAFVVLKKPEALDEAVRVLNTRVIFGKPLSVQIAKSDSDVVLKNNKTKDYDLAKLKQQRLDKRNERLKDKTRDSKKRSRENDENDTGNVSGSEGKSKRPKIISTVPNKILIVTGLPKEVKTENLIDIFEKYTGFININYVSVRSLALVEFDNENNSAECMKELGENPTFLETVCTMTFAKK